MTTTTEAAHVCPPEHRHDQTGNCYSSHGCRCSDCREHHRLSARNLRRAKLYGRYQPREVMPAEPVRQHVRRLSEYGIGIDRVAGIAGVSTGGIRNLVYGRTGRPENRKRPPREIGADLGRKVLAVKADPRHLAPGAVVPARGVHRRLQALVRQGWSQARLADRLGMTRQQLNAMLLRSPGVTITMHRTIDALYDELWDKKPPRTEHYDLIAYNRAIRHATSRGWQSPLAWDDIDLDDAPSRLAEYQDDDVDDAVVAIAITGAPIDLTPAEREAAVVSLHAQRFSDVEIAERLHCTTRTVLRIRHERLNLPAVAGNNAAA
jgi:transcriptional regulator with XRE-family HTH domain